MAAREAAVAASSPLSVRWGTSASVRLTDRLADLAATLDAVLISAKRQRDTAPSVQSARTEGNDRGPRRVAGSSDTTRRCCSRLRLPFWPSPHPACADRTGDGPVNAPKPLASIHSEFILPGGGWVQNVRQEGGASRLGPYVLEAPTPVANTCRPCGLI